MKKATTKEPAVSRQKYDDTFKQQALQMIRLGQSVPKVAETLGMSESVLYKWKAALQPDVLDHELEQLRAKLKQVETERDILYRFPIGFTVVG